MTKMISKYHHSAVIIIWIVIGIQQVLSPNYLLQAGTPVTTQSFISPEQGCNWAGVAGQVFDENGSPVNGLVVELHGQYLEQEISIATTTGSSQQMGVGGFDLQLSDHPINTQAVFYIQLVDASGAPLSQKTYFNTTDACDQNLVIINFFDFGPHFDNYLPIINHS